MPPENPHLSIFNSLISAIVLLVAGIGSEIWTVLAYSAINLAGFILILSSVALGIWCVSTPTRPMRRIGWGICIVVLMVEAFHLSLFVSYMHTGAN